MPSISDNQTRYYSGVDIGGTTAKAVVAEVVDAVPSLLEASIAEISSEVARGPRHVIDVVIPEVISQSLRQVGLSHDDIAAYGIDFPSVVSNTGRVLAVGNMRHPDWQGFDVQTDLVTKIGRIDPVCPRFVFVENDGAATMFGISQQLPLKEQNKTITGFFVGTGLGGGTTTGGVNRFTNEGGGSEPGATHIQFDEDKFLFGEWGEANIRKLEDFVSLVAIERQLEKMHARGAIPSGHPLLELQDTESKSKWRLMAEKLLTYANQALAEERFDDFSLRIFEVQRRALGLYVQQHIQFIRPAHIFIGGGVVDSARVTDQFRTWYVDGVKECARQEIDQPLRQTTGFPEFHTPNQGDAVAPFGAAIMAWRRDPTAHG